MKLFQTFTVKIFHGKKNSTNMVTLSKQVQAAAQTSADERENLTMTL